MFVKEGWPPQFNEVSVPGVVIVAVRLPATQGGGAERVRSTIAGASTSSHMNGVCAFLQSITRILLIENFCHNCLCIACGLVEICRSWLLLNTFLHLSLVQHFQIQRGKDYNNIRGKQSFMESHLNQYFKSVVN